MLPKVITISSSHIIIVMCNFSFNHFFFSFANFSFQIQFLIVFVHTAQIQFYPSCKYPKFIGFLLTLNAGIFTYMFSSFYIKSYKKKYSSKSELNEVENKNNVSYSNNGITLDKLNSSIAEKTKEALNVKLKKIN